MMWLVIWILCGWVAAYIRREEFYTGRSLMLSSLLGLACVGAIAGPLGLVLALLGKIPWENLDTVIHNKPASSNAANHGSTSFIDSIEIQRLRRENESLKRENDRLKAFLVD